MEFERLHVFGESISLPTRSAKAACYNQIHRIIAKRPKSNVNSPRQVNVVIIEKAIKFRIDMISAKAQCGRQSTMFDVANAQIGATRQFLIQFRVELCTIHHNQRNYRTVVLVRYTLKS